MPTTTPSLVAYVQSIAPCGGFWFDPARPYTYCRICGTLVQHSQDEVRRRWSHRHARFAHTATEHRQLALSGRWLTPEAAYRLAAFGVIDLQGLALDDELIHAYASSSATPLDNPETF